MNEPQSVSEFKSKSGWKRLIAAFGYSMQGLKSAWNGEHAFRQELFMLAFGVLAALALPASGLRKWLLIAVLILVLIVELLNSAIEAIVDRISLEHHPLSKNAKDFGSAAVLLALALAAITWIVVLAEIFA